MIPSNAWLIGADDCDVLALRGVSLHFTFCSLDLLSFLIVAYHTTSHVIACNLSIRVGVFSHDRRDSLFPCTQSASFTTAMVSHPVLPTNYQSMTFVTRVYVGSRDLRGHEEGVIVAMVVRLVGVMMIVMMMERYDTIH